MPWYQASYVTSQYASGALYLLGLSTTLLCMASLVPRKVLVTETELVLKSLTYYSRRFHLSAIRGIGVMRPWEFFRRKLWKQRVRVLHWAIFRKGVLLELHHRNAYFLWFARPDEVALELEIAVSRAKAPRAGTAPPPLPGRAAS